MKAPTHRQIYRRRRALALVVLLVAVGLIWWGIAVMRADTGSNASHSKPTPTVAGPIVACPNSAIKITAFVGVDSVPQTQFASSVNPNLWFGITNISKRACTFEAGSIGQFFTITTGPDTVWQSKDCDRSGDVSAVVTLQPNQTMTSPPSPWYRVMSSATGCGKGQNPVVAGGASYHLSVTVNGAKSANDVQFVLN